MSLQQHLHERNPFPIASMSVADRHVHRRDNIHWDSLAQRWFRLFTLRSPSANLLGYTELLNLTACFPDEKSAAAWLHGCYPQSTMWDPLSSWQDSHLQSLLITHGNATVHGVAWDWLWGGCPGSLAASLVSSKPSTVNYTTTWRSKYARRWFPGVIQVAPQEAVTLTPLIYPVNSFWSVGRPQLIWCCGSIPMDLTLLGSIQLHSRTVLSRRTNAEAEGAC